MERGDWLLSQESQAESHVLTCLTRLTTLIPISTLLNLLFPVRTHSVALCLVWSALGQRAAHSRLEVNAKSRGLALPVCPRLLPRLTAGLPSRLAHLIVYQVKAQ